MNMEKELLLQLLMEKYGKQVTPNSNAKKMRYQNNAFIVKNISGILKTGSAVTIPGHLRKMNFCYIDGDSQMLSFKQIGLLMERSTGAVEIRFRQKLNPNLQGVRA